MRPLVAGYLHWGVDNGAVGKEVAGCWMAVWLDGPYMDGVSLSGGTGLSTREAGTRGEGFGVRGLGYTGIGMFRGHRVLWDCPCM